MWRLIMHRGWRQNGDFWAITAAFFTQPPSAFIKAQRWQKYTNTQIPSTLTPFFFFKYSSFTDFTDTQTFFPDILCFDRPAPPELTQSSQSLSPFDKHPHTFWNTHMHTHSGKKKKITCLSWDISHSWHRASAFGDALLISGGRAHGRVKRVCPLRGCGAN